MKDIYDVIIIGAGASGLAAGIYSARSGLKTLVVEESEVGGVACKSYCICNYPGFPEIVDGIELMDKFYRQARNAGVEFFFEGAKSIWEKSGLKYVSTRTETFKTYGIIVATGGKAKRVGAINESNLIGKGISFCSICDAPETKGKDILVIGVGDSSVDQILYLSHFAKKVYVSSINPRGEFDCKDVKKIELIPANVEFLWNTAVFEFHGKEHLHKVTLVDEGAGEFFDLPCDYCFEFIGFEPNSSVFRDLIETDETGAIITDENMQTSIPGVYAVGDVRKKKVKQLTTATADGAIGAYNVKIFVDDMKSNRRN